VSERGKLGWFARKEIYQSKEGNQIICLLVVRKRGTATRDDLRGQRDDSSGFATTIVDPVAPKRSSCGEPLCFLITTKVLLIFAAQVNRSLAPGDMT